MWAHCLAAAGFACGPALAGVIGDQYGLSAPFFLCGAGMSIAAASALVFLPETMRRAKAAVKEEPQPGAAAIVKEEVSAAQAAGDQAVWQKWSKLLRVPNLQAVYVRNTLTCFAHMHMRSTHAPTVV